MRVTEAEAKEKLCPLIQRNCVGKGCMAFIWVDHRFIAPAPVPMEDEYRCGMVVAQ